MKVKNIKSILSLVFLYICCLPVHGAGFVSISDCLITNDIGIYNFRQQYANMGPGSGSVGLAGHFNKDHVDKVCTGTYTNIGQISGLPVEEMRQKLLIIEIEITQHEGVDSDKWLLHEMDSAYRDNYGIPDDSYDVHVIDGNTIFRYGSGGWDYRWVAGNKVIKIDYTDLQMTNPEPLEIVKAYLAKHPSTITPITLVELRSDENKTQWIKDEMERRLWLGDKWTLQIQPDDAELGKKLGEIVNHMELFLNYRDKYFDKALYALDVTQEKNLLQGYLTRKDAVSINNKLTEYKDWWNVNKSGSITLP